MKYNRRLTVDHIRPGAGSTLENTRILCHSCNTRRGAAEQTDEQVLSYMNWWWEQRLAPRLLFWLNIAPGVGGRLHRNEACEKRDSRFYTDEELAASVEEDTEQIGVTQQ